MAFSYLELMLSPLVWNFWIQPLCSLSGLDVLCIIFHLNLYKYVHGFYTVKCVFIVNIKNNEIELLTGELFTFHACFATLETSCSHVQFNEPQPPTQQQVSCAHNQSWVGVADMQTIRSVTLNRFYMLPLHTHFNLKHGHLISTVMFCSCRTEKGSRLWA